MSKLRRLLSVLMAAFMLLTLPLTTGIARTVADGTNEPAESGSVELEMEDLDPATLHVHKLGEVEEEEAEPEVPSALITELDPSRDPNEIVRVSIFLDGKSTIEQGYSTRGIADNSKAVAYRKKLQKQQDDLTSKIEKAVGHELNVKWNLTLLVNAISVEVPYKDTIIIARMPGVKSVEFETQYEAPRDAEADHPNTAVTSSDMVGAQEAWANGAGYTGAGSRIAIIDTGLDTTHQSFNEDAFNHAIAEDRAKGKTVDLMTSIPSSGLNGSGRRISAKIPYAYNYVDNNNTVNHLSDTQGEHGSHVAGIATANRYIKNGSSYVDAASTVGAVGMAPDAQVVVMKVFGSSGGAYDSDYFVALEDAILLGCDAANLSLGSSTPGFTYSTSYQTNLNNFVNNTKNNHMVISISAGNNGSFDQHLDQKLYAEDVQFHTGGSPGTYVNSLGTAAAQNIGTVGAPLVYNGTNIFYTETESSGAKMKTVPGTWNFVYIDATGQTTDYSTVNAAVSLSGKIVMVNRGTNSFYEKGNNLKSYNPKALIVVNNQEGTISMALDDYTGTFPMVSILLSEGQMIKSSASKATRNGITYYTGSITVTDTTQVGLNTTRENATMATFSSWGVPGSLLMKPEITAPGGSIYSVYGTNKTESNTTAGGADQYELMSGTSMAAPHIAGLAGVVAQYMRENGNLSDTSKKLYNTQLTGSYNVRAIMQSLLMSTATPMKPNGNYLAVMQQGAGLTEVNKAVNAKSVIMMNEAGLTTKTGANTDGKVKVELGDDPDRTGSYEYSFTVYNITDETLTFDLSTKLFTQAIDGENLSHGTVDLPDGGVTYTWNGAAVSTESHDVNKDGVTDELDAQAILDLLSGELEIDDENYDFDAGKMDDDDEITSHDAKLLLDWTAEQGETGYFVPAHGKVQVTVHINLTDAQKAVFDARECGGYLEGYTYVTCTTADQEGVSYAHQHSIPILGYYGSWTDPTMFDTNSYAESLYGNTQTNYSGVAADSTNYMTITTNGTAAKFSGNPYMVEDEFPWDRLALRTDARIGEIGYNLIRNAGATGYAVSAIDENGNVTSVKTATVNATNVTGQYYNESSAAWMNTAKKTYNPNALISSYGFADGDRARIGFYAIPEYNAMVVKNSYNAANSGTLTTANFQTLLLSNVLGRGAMVGYGFYIDNTAPTFGTITKNDPENPTTITVNVTDNFYVACLKLTSADGSTVYGTAIPEQTAPNQNASYTFTLPSGLTGSVAVFAGDYAGNETAVKVKLNDNEPEYRTVYVLTSTLTAGEKYLIVSRNTAGSGYALYYTLNTSGSTATAAADGVTVQSGISATNSQPYINAADVEATGIWTVGSGSTSGTYTFNNNGWYLRRSNNNALTITKDTSRRDWTWDGTNNRLSINSRYLRYYNNNFSLNTATNSVYLYQETQIIDDDPNPVESVTVSPSALTLIPGLGNSEGDLSATVLPITVQDKSVTWSSSNTTVATVDQNGHVTAGSSTGTATITATSVAKPAISGTATVTVSGGSPINVTVYGQVAYGESDVRFASINLNNMSITKLGTAQTAFTGGGRGGDYIYGNDADGSFMRYSASTYAIDSDYTFTINPDILVLDGANLPTFTVTSSGTTYTFDYSLVGVAPNGLVTFFKNDSDGTVSYFDFSELSNFVAITFIGYYKDTTNNRTYYYFYALGSDGALYLLAPYGTVSDGTQALNAAYGDGIPVNGLTMGSDLSAYSMTYAYGLNSSYDGVLIADNTTKAIYYVDTSNSSATEYSASYVGQVSNATNIAALYDNTYDAATSLSSSQAEELNSLIDWSKTPMTATTINLFETEEAEDPFAIVEPVEPDDGTELEPVEPDDAFETVEPEDGMDVVEPTEPEDGMDVVEPTEPEDGMDVVEPAEPEDGANAISNGASRAHIGIFRTVNGTATNAGVLPLKESVASFNGEFAVEYTPSELHCTAEPGVWGTGADKKLWVSIFVDEDTDTDKGVVTVAYAVKGDTALSTDQVIATLTFTAQTCSETGSFEVEVDTLERNTDLELGGDEEIVMIDVPAGGHAWGEPTYVWADDNSTVTATRVCANDASHVETETVDTTSTTTAATCETAGSTVYTATFENDAFTTQTKTVEIPATGHAWGEPEWTWTGSDDTAWTAATATFTCANDSTHVETVNATIAQAEDNGYLVFTATATFDGKTYTDTKRIEIGYYLIGTISNWEPDATYKFAPNAGAAGEYMLNVTNLAVGAEIKVVRAAGTTKLTWYPSDAGNYTVDYAHSGNVNVYFRPAGNVWNDFFTGGFFYISKLHGVQVITDGNGTASVDPIAPDVTAMVTLAATPNDGYHFDRVEFYQKTGEGENDITAVSITLGEGNTFTMPDYDVVIKVYFEAHVWGEPTYTWADDNSRVTATRVCTVCGETETETVNTTSEITKQATCEAAGETTYTATFTQAGFTTQTKTEANIPATGHNWGEVSYTWADDNSGVTASRVCTRDESHVETETVNATSEVKTAATCEGKGTTTYTATFTNAAFATQTKDVEDIAALEHDWTFVDFTWTEIEGGYTAVANYKCSRDDSHTKTETATVTSETTAATCEAEGQTVYTATEGDHTDTKTVTIAALGHNWTFVDFTWTGDDENGYTAAVANYKCSHDAAHIKTENATVTSVTTAATCEAAGQTVYTATVTATVSADEEEHTDTKTVTIPAKGHAWGEPTYVWAEDNSTVTATRVCANDPTHIETETANTTYAVTKEPTFTTVGEGTYTATFTNEAFAEQTKQVEIPKLTQRATVAYVDFRHGKTLQVFTVEIKADEDTRTPAFDAFDQIGEYDDCRYDSSNMWTTPVATKVTGDTVYVLKWINVYTVTFLNADGAVAKTVSVDEGGTIPTDEIPTPEKTGYTLTGWREADLAFNLETPITRNITLTPVYKINTYTVTFMNGEAVYMTINVEHGATLAEPEQPTDADNHVFAGWYNGETKFNFNTPITDDMTLTAHWSEDIVKIGTRIEFVAGAVEYNGTTPYVIWDRNLADGHQPTFKVEGIDGHELTRDTDYTYAYRENKQAGTGYIFVTVTNANYSSPADKRFKIYLPASETLTVDNISTGIKLTWAPVEGAAGYVIYRRAWSSTTNGWTSFERWNNVTNEAAAIEGSTDLSWIDGSDDTHKVYAGTRYQYGVKAFFERRHDPIAKEDIGGNVNDPSGNYNLGIVSPLKTTVRITTRTLSSVTSTASGKLTVKWSGSKVFTGYQVQIATDDSFEENVIVKKDQITSASTYSKVYDGLASGTSYYVRIRSYHEFGGMTYYGGWSAVKNATVQ